MQIELTRDTILGVGKIEYPEGAPTNMGDASRSGFVMELKSGKKGQVVSVPDSIANRLISLGSARVPQMKKAA